MHVLLTILLIIAWIIAVLLVLTIIISLLRIRINVGVIEKKLYLAVYFYRLKIFSMNKKLKFKDKEKKERPKIEFDSLMSEFKKWTGWFNSSKKELASLLKLAQKKIRIQTYSIIMDIGVGNAATTGIICGAASAFISLITSFIGHYIDIEEHTQIIVNPKSDKVFDISGNIIVNFKIVGLLQLFLAARKLEIYKQFKAQKEIK